ncbi:uncharacterized protein KY384_001763 [Bacidia gigantensis]|uniref:uncharacterized protein n=1 Tax=Bacidia gigantensis TaxID=2732470 RepID=UPI001D04C435|nr:uncharacterized protein KY384_001763 [Bacidia gigantensis]KAG8532981.1 hypothetical protein KY384_001763 [Bacidia gigantensis]
MPRRKFCDIESDLAAAKAKAETFEDIALAEQEHCEQLEKDLAEKEEEIGRVRSSCDQQQSDLIIKDEEIGRVRAEALRERHDAVEGLGEQVKKKEEEIAKMKGEMARNSKRFWDEIGKKNGDITRARETMEKEKGEVVEGLTRNLAAKEEEVARVRVEMGDKYEQFQNDIAKKSAAIGRARLETQRKNKSVEAKEVEITLLRIESGRKIEQFQTELARKDQETTTVRLELHRQMDGEAERVHNAVAAKEAEIVHIRGEMQKSRQALQQQVSEREEEIDRIRTEMHKQNESKEKLQQDLAEAKADLIFARTEIQNDREAMQECLTKRKEEIEDLRAKLMKQKKGEAEVQKDLAATERQRLNLKEHRDELLTGTLAKEAEIGRIRLEMQNLREQLRRDQVVKAVDINSVRASTQEYCETLRKNLAKKDDEISRLEGEINDKRERSEQSLRAKEAEMTRATLKIQQQKQMEIDNAKLELEKEMEMKIKKTKEIWEREKQAEISSLRAELQKNGEQYQKSLTKKKTEISRMRVDLQKQEDDRSNVRKIVEDLGWNGEPETQRMKAHIHGLHSEYGLLLVNGDDFLFTKEAILDYGPKKTVKLLEQRLDAWVQTWADPSSPLARSSNWKQYCVMIYSTTKKAKYLDSFDHPDWQQAKSRNSKALNDFIGVLNSVSPWIEYIALDSTKKAFDITFGLLFIKYLKDPKCKAIIYGNEGDFDEILDVAKEEGTILRPLLWDPPANFNASTMTDNCHGISFNDIFVRHRSLSLQHEQGVAALLADIMENPDWRPPDSPPHAPTPSRARLSPKESFDFQVSEMRKNPDLLSKEVDDLVSQAEEPSPPSEVNDEQKLLVKLSEFQKAYQVAERRVQDAKLENTWCKALCEFLQDEIEQIHRRDKVREYPTYMRLWRGGKLVEDSSPISPIHHTPVSTQIASPSISVQPHPALESTFVESTLVRPQTLQAQQPDMSVQIAELEKCCGLSHQELKDLEQETMDYGSHEYALCLELEKDLGYHVKIDRKKREIKITNRYWHSPLEKVDISASSADRALCSPANSPADTSCKSSRVHHMAKSTSSPRSETELPSKRPHRDSLARTSPPMKVTEYHDPFPPSCKPTEAPMRRKKPPTPSPSKRDDNPMKDKQVLESIPTMAAETPVTSRKQLNTSSASPRFPVPPTKPRVQIPLPPRPIRDGNGSQNPPGPSSARLSILPSGPPPMIFDADNNRVDPPLAQSPGIAHSTVASKHCCNNHYLRGSCVYRNCVHSHNSQLSEDEMNALRWVGRSILCRNGRKCSDPECFAGHMCPRKQCDINRCHFPKEMHESESEMRSRLKKGEKMKEKRESLVENQLAPTPGTSMREQEDTAHLNRNREENHEQGTSSERRGDGLAPTISNRRLQDSPRERRPPPPSDDQPRSTGDRYINKPSDTPRPTLPPHPPSHPKSSNDDPSPTGNRYIKKPHTQMGGVGGPMRARESSS